MVQIADAIFGSREVRIVDNVPTADGDYQVINADCLAGPEHPQLCSVYMAIRAEDILQDTGMRRPIGAAAATRAPAQGFWR